MDTFYIRQAYLQRPASMLTMPFGEWFHMCAAPQHESLCGMGMDAACTYILNNKLNELPDLMHLMATWNETPIP